MSPHSILGVRADADADEIRRRYRELAKVCHPDVGGDPASFIRLQQAYKQLLEEKSNPKAAAPAEPQTWNEDVAEPLQQEAAGDSRPKWWDEIVQDKSGVHHKEEKKRNLYVERALPDRSFLKLALATLGCALVVTLACCIKGGAPDVQSALGQMIIYSTFLFVASAFSAAVGSGIDEEAFIKTYLGVLSLLAFALVVAVPLPFLKPT